jgi:hypothetical protein
LINQWVTDKIRLDVDEDLYNYVDVNEMNTFSQNERELNKLKTELLQEDFLDIKGLDYDKYDEAYITQDIVGKIMKKKFFDEKKLMDTESSKKAASSDTRLKIEKRHQAVKENREKRLKEVEQKRKEKLEKKEIELKAKQIVQKEEEDKRMRENIEKQLIEQEAQRLRLEMAQQRQRDQELRRRLAIFGCKNIMPTPLRTSLSIFGLYFQDKGKLSRCKSKEKSRTC